MEGIMYQDIYRGKRILVTGHCGFKGSWLVHWLKRLGAEVVGYGHPPNTEPNHFELLGHHSGGEGSDLRDIRFLLHVMREQRPDLILHLAAKAIVARTFEEPRETFENNVMGAVNILEAARKCPSVKGVVMITTDKVYEDKNWQWGYRENDKLGGVDPYSASKVCIEQVIRCYREAFGMNIATARAGNVIGGGDWSYKRLIPDIVRAAAEGKPSIIHTPNATRPWQHVLDPLNGYLMLGQRILEGLDDVGGAWNFGPDGDPMTVMDILTLAHEMWPAVTWEIDSTATHPYMVYLLKIDNTKAKKELGWYPRWCMEDAVMSAIGWYKKYYAEGKILTDHDIDMWELREV
jgi:CDP-glucose 4,6-dehydratase